MYFKCTLQNKPTPKQTKRCVFSKSYFPWNTISAEQFQQALVASELKIPV